MEARLSLKNASFSYQDKNVFTSLNLDVREGEVLCIMGANGCGKTTLLRCLNGSLRLKAGQVILENRDIATMTITNTAKKVGIVFQEHNAPFPFSVLEVVRMGRAPHLSLFSQPSARDTRIAEEMLEKVGIGHLKLQPYTQISGGERQLALIARTLTQGPEIILFDEPTSHLDFKNQALVLQIINQLAEDGLSIVMSSHMPDYALLYSSRVVLMNKGSFLAVDSPDKVITEGNLKEIYGIDVKILSIEEPGTGKKIRFCLPVTNKVG